MSAVPATEAPTAIGKAAAKVRAITEAAQQAVAGAAEASTRVVVPVAATAVKEALYERAEWVVYADDDLTPEDFSDPKVWQFASQHGPRRWKLRDRIEIVQSNRLTHCIVVDEGVDFTTLMVLNTWELPPQRSAMERKLKRGFSIRRGRPGQDPFIVYRDADDLPMSAGQDFRSYEAAFRWAYDHQGIGPDTE